MPAHPHTREELTEALALVERHGSISAAARAIDMPRQTLQSRVDEARRILAREAREGHAPGHFDSGVAPGYLMGKVTVQRNANGGVERTWERQSPEDADRQAAFRAFIEELSEGIKGLSPHVPAPPPLNSDLLAVYPIGDQHHGMKADARETGQADWDCAISADVLARAIDHLATGAPAADEALLINCGDFLDLNDSRNVTPKSGNVMDVDTRFGQVLQSGAMALIHATLRLLEKHRRVLVWNLRGNHDPDAAMALAIAMSCYFHNNPRVTVDLGTGLYKYHRFGKVLIGGHHGDKAKAANLPLIMAADRPEDWGATTHRYFHVGHFHKRMVDDFPGVDVEAHRVLGPGNAWSAGEGYRPKRDMQVILYHRDHGEAERHRFDLAMLA